MRANALLAAVAAIALAGPAFAQQPGGQTGGQTGGQPGSSPTSPMTQSPSTSGAQSGQTGSQTPSGQSAQSMSRPSPASQQQVRQSLQQAGFRNVQILDAAYLIQAQTQSGEMVMMLVNPPTGGAAGASGASGATSGMTGGSGGTSGSGGSGTQSPTQQTR